ncbi:MAG: hypothetical protein JXR58_13070 [Bacteroidales bacterium]|nr:hypothetical protein [Bacteroidales bacterium]
MKTIKFLTALLFTFCLATNSFAGNNPNKNQKKIFNKIGQYLNFSNIENTKTDLSFVLVEIEIGPDGQLVVKESCGNPGLQDYVTTQIEKIRLSGSENIIGQTFQYKIEFQE